ncbi:MAG TPA: AI-2E family transporter, partial [Xanthomarina gelatinilytica]|nr:AI-2E family transporter [Xanthomarina gelatinilytica]
MDKLRTTNILLLVIVVPLIFYLLKILSFIFIPLVFSMFIALLFLPIMRWLGKKNIPKPISILIVVLIIAAGMKIGVELIQISSREILNSDTEFFSKAEEKFDNLFLLAQETFGFKLDDKESVLKQFIAKDNIGDSINFIQRTLTMLLMTTFFVVLWL